jgi:hypothetical protein
VIELIACEHDKNDENYLKIIKKSGLAVFNNLDFKQGLFSIIQFVVLP